MLTSAEASALLGVSLRTLWAWKEKGLIPFCKIGGSVRFKTRDFETALDRFRSGGGR
jgi:excisionase family DNA binding protein